MNSLEKSCIIKLPEFSDARGSLSFFENNSQLPFEIGSYQVLSCNEILNKNFRFEFYNYFIVMFTGNAQINIKRNDENQNYNLHEFNEGVYIPRGGAFSVIMATTNSVFLVVSDKKDPLYKKGKSFIGQSTTITDCNIISNTSNYYVPKRFYYLYNIPKGESRGEHAHKQLYQVITAIKGCFCIEIDDGTNKREIYLDNPQKHLFIVPGIWRRLSKFSSDAICLVAASECYSEKDYIRKYTDFINYKKG